MTWADHGEDDWILEQFPPGYIGAAVDVGAYNGTFYSNTNILEQFGWKVLCIEPQPDIQTELRERRKLTVECACGSADAEQVEFKIHTRNRPSFSGLKPVFGHSVFRIDPDAPWETVLVSVRRLDRLLEEHGFSDLDVLSVDTEGTELDVLLGFNFDRWKPKVVVVESWEPASPTASHVSDQGYTFIERRHANDLFLRCPKN